MNRTSRPNRPCRFVTALFAAVLAFLPSLTFAEGSIAGTLTHATRGTPLQGASVRLTPGEREAVTDRSGAFYFSQVPAGGYSVEGRTLGVRPFGVRENARSGQRDEPTAGRTHGVRPFGVRENARSGQEACSSARPNIERPDPVAPRGS